jgi:hypothetical protein
LSDIAISNTSAAPTAPKPGKTTRIPKNILRALELLASGECKTVKAAAERVGITREWLSRLMQRSHIQAFITRKSRENIQRGTMRASARLIELIDAESEHVAAKVAERILTSEGILRSDSGQVSVNVGVSVGYVIDLSGSAAPTIDAQLTRTIEHE